MEPRPVLTVAALPPASPVLARVRPAVPGPGGVLIASLGKIPHLGSIVDPLGAESTKACHVGVAGEEAAVRRGHGPAQDVCDPVGGPGSQLGAQPRRAELVEGVLHRVLAHGGLHLRELSQWRVVQQERPLQVGLHDPRVRVREGEKPKSRPLKPETPSSDPEAHGRFGGSRVARAPVCPPT